MAHEDMTVDDVLDLVDELRPVTTQAGKTSDLGLGFVMYDAFSVRGSYDDYGGGCWGFGIALGDGSWASRVFGERLTIRSTREEVRAALKAIDRYARLRLGSGYLEAYAAAYSEQHSPSDGGGSTVNLSEAIVLFLKHYPGKNEFEFRQNVDTAMRDAVRTILDETMKIQIVWGEKTLIDVGCEVQEVMQERHPELTDAAVKRLGNFFTYLMK